LIDETNPATPSTDEEPPVDSAVTVAEPQEPETAEASTANGDAGAADEGAKAAEAPTGEAAATEDSTALGAETSAEPMQQEPPAAAAEASVEPDEASVEPAAAAIEVAPAEPEPSEPAAGTSSAEPMTMAELLDNPENEVKSLKHGDVVEGTVVRIDPDEILVDFGGKSEGVVSNRELMNRRGSRDGDEARPEIEVGNEVLVYVLQPESPEGHAVLSLRRAGLERKWRGMQERFDAGEIVEARVIDHNKGGLIVDLGVRGFVPISQIVDFPRRPRDEQPRDAAQEIAEKLQPFVGRTLRLKILEVNRKANRLILSEKVALYEERREKRDELFSSLETGQRVTGVVRSIAPFGVFVDLGGIDGLVHKSELSWNKVNNPETAYQIGDEVEAEVIDINHERGRISLSIRRLQPDPWHSTVADLKVGDIIEGSVTKIVNFGAFVRVREGLEGLIHISELSQQRVAHPGDVVHEGQKLRLKVISLDSERHRLGLSLKQAEEAPVRAAPPEPRERRGRSERSYDPSQAVQEPEGGIDNTLAAAFAQVRQQIAEQDRQARVAETDDARPATDERAVEATASADAPAPVAEAVADQAPASASVADAEAPSTTADTTTADAEAVGAEALAVVQAEEEAETELAAEIEGLAEAEEIAEARVEAEAESMSPADAAAARAELADAEADAESELKARIDAVGEAEAAVEAEVMADAVALDTQSATDGAAATAADESSVATASDDAGASTASTDEAAGAGTAAEG